MKASRCLLFPRLTPLIGGALVGFARNFTLPSRAHAIVVPDRNPRDSRREDGEIRFSFRTVEQLSKRGVIALSFRRADAGRLLQPAVEARGGIPRNVRGSTLGAIVLRLKCRELCLERRRLHRCRAFGLRTSIGHALMGLHAPFDGRDLVGVGVRHARRASREEHGRSEKQERRRRQDFGHASLINWRKAGPLTREFAPGPSKRFKGELCECGDGEPNCHQHRSRESDEYFASCVASSSPRHGV